MHAHTMAPIKYNKFFHHFFSAALCVSGPTRNFTFHCGSAASNVRGDSPSLLAKKGTSILGFIFKTTQNDKPSEQQKTEKRNISRMDAVLCSVVGCLCCLVVVTFYRLIISSIVKPSGFLFMTPVSPNGLLCGDGVDDFCDKSKIGSCDDVDVDEAVCR